MLISVSTAAICWVMSLVGFTASNVTSEYWAAWALALLAIAAIQPWSAAGAEKPMVTAGPDAVLAPAVRRRRRARRAPPVCCWCRR